MEWAREHPYLSALIAAAAFIVFGALIVGYRAAQPSSGGLQVWGGTPDTFINTTSYEPGPATDTQAPSIGSDNAPTFTALAPSQQVGSQDNTVSDFDMSAFIASISRPAATATTAQTSGSADLSLAYSFIRTGLVATTTPGPTRSTLQESLYQYGNDTGSNIATYENAHTNAGQVLTDQVQDRQNPDKAQAVRDLGVSLQAVGKKLQQMDSVPSIVAAAHAALAQSYIDAGTQLAKVPDAQSDQDFVAAMEAYDSSADRLAHSYVALANMFAGAGVTFSPQDPGAVFSFSGGGGL